MCWWDNRRKLWRADTTFALEDMKRTGRPLDLVRVEVADEFI